MPTAHTSTPLTTLLEQISNGLDEHFDEEEAEILPIVERVITAAEYHEVGQRGLASIPLTRRLIVLGYLLEDATPRERTDFLAAIPAPARLAYRLIEYANTATRRADSAPRYDPEQTAGPEHRPVRIGQRYRAAVRRPADRAIAAHREPGAGVSRR